MMFTCSSLATSAPGAAITGLAGIASNLVACFSVAVQHGAQHLGQPKSGLCRLMDAAGGSVSLGRMMNLGRL
jgi:hypothetical protein